MRLKLAFSLTLLIAIQSVTCQNQHNRQRGNVNDESQKLNIVADSVTNLAQKISNAITSQKSKTEIFSPVSIAGALSLLLLGASGTTRTELENVMGFDSRISFTDIHKSFGKLFRELVTNDPILKSEIPWRATDKCNNYDYDDDDVGMRGGFQAPQTPAKRPKRQSECYINDGMPVEVTIGNGIFSQDGQMIDEKYGRLADQLYQTNISTLDFHNNPSRAIDTINKWVRNQTRCKINEIVSNLSPETQLVIANTLYFRAEWEEPFLKDGTKPRKFFPNGPEKAGYDVPMMVHGGCFPYFNWKEADTRVVGFPYKRNITMYVFLPNNSNRIKLVGLGTKVNADVINDIIQKMEVKTVSIQFPKLHMVNSFGMKELLEQLGADSVFDQKRSQLYRVISGGSKFGGGEVEDEDEDIFDQLEDTEKNARDELKEKYPGCTPTENDHDNRQDCERNPLCKFGGGVCVCCAKMFGSARVRRQAQAQSLFVNEVVHKVDVVVNEKGTEGGAVTATLLDRITPQINFRVTGPFLMLIRDETTKLPLFYGNVYDPAS
ncbi:serine protease inhibitor 28Dc-like isoform X3 [Uranotaenia lowii]|uniref:serine protease inhibitor 28Dc-like isoform X3 n=1 Tax=Uranotaenia lowii TaxID=190385 RepID=UPI00247ACA54|nr:serine protease inhibitor 28Dc-like isoform X3 [Uranotaenia lowii]